MTIPHISLPRKISLLRVCNTLKFVVLALVVVWVVFAILHRILEPSYGWFESFDWAQYTMTTNGEGTYVPTNDATRVLTMLLRPTAVIATVIATAHVVRNAVVDPDAFTHDEQRELLYYVRALADERGLPKFDTTKHCLDNDKEIVT